MGIEETCIIYKTLKEISKKTKNKTETKI